MIAMTSAPRLYWPSSAASGRFTLMTMSASLSASAATVAPTAVNSESGRPDLIPAPGSTKTSTPSALNFFTVSGEAATRGSAGSISLATAIFMGPPAARKTRRRDLPRQLCKSDTGLATTNAGSRRALSQNRASLWRREQASGQEDRHHGDDEDDGGGAILHQLDEAFIGLLMGHVIVAVSGRVGHFAMVCHLYPQ